MELRINFTTLVFLITFCTVFGQKCTACDKNESGTAAKHRRAVTDSSDSQTPWQVCVNFLGEDSLIKHRNCYCGGVLVSPKWVISNAHCFRSNDVSSPRRKSQFQFVLGMSAGKQRQMFKAKSIIFHDGYRPSKQACVPGDNDIALIELDQTAKTNNNHVKAIQLPKNDTNVGGLRCSVADWNGRTGTDISHAAVSVPLDLGVCPTSTNVRKSDVLKGESGGAIVCGQQNKTLAGVVMTGRKCGKTGTFLVITEYLSWITQNTGLTS